jgi:integrase
MSITKVTKGYTIRWYDADGRERQQTYKGIDREEARRLEREKLAERDRGERPADERHAPLFKTFAATWIEESRSGWKPSTLQQYQQVLKSQLLPAFGELRITQITESRVRQAITGWQDGLPKEGEEATDSGPRCHRTGGLSARRLNLVLVLLKTILGVARRRRWLREDPLLSVRLLREPQTEVDPLAPEEVDAFLKVCPPWWRPYFTVAVWTGARPNELGALKWGDVDWSSSRFRIRAGRYRGVESTPKTSSSIRDVDMLPPVVDAMRAQKKQQAAVRLKAGLGVAEPGQDYVFTGPEGGLLNPNWIRDRIWYPTLTKTQLRRRTVYQTRHSFASNALAAGEAPSWVAAQLGHATPEMLFKVYARWIPNRTRRDGSALLSRMVETTPETVDCTGEIRASEPVAAASHRKIS